MADLHLPASGLYCLENESLDPARHRKPKASRAMWNRKPTIWQIACGKPGRDYREIFLRHDVMFMGPGKPGPFDTKSYRRSLRNGELSKSQFNQLRQFSSKPVPGDLVLLRFAHEVIRIGRIPENGGYFWSPAFEDVYGWDLQHCRRVLWGGPSGARLLRQRRRPLFSNHKQQPTFTAVWEQRIRKCLSALQAVVSDRRLHSLPPHVAELSLEDFGIALFRSGLSNESVERAIDAIEKNRRLDSWYQEFRDPSESEIITHMTVPLMLSLGWSEQLLAVEWRSIDLAFFSHAPTDPRTCVMICEAKRRFESLEHALGQAKDYMRTRGLTRCRWILLTTGTLLFSYRRRGASWILSGFVNLKNLQDRYLIPHRASAVKTLIGLVPSRIIGH